MVQLFHTQGFPIEWWAYARVLAVPTILWSVLLLAGNWIALRPEQELQVGREFVRSELRKMGPMRLQETVTAAVVLVSIAYWVTDRWHHQPAFLIGMLGMAVFAAFGILREKDFGSAISWPLVLFLGALLGLPTVVQQTQVDQWLAGYIVPLIQSVSGNIWLLFMAVAILMYAARFLDPVGFLAFTVLFLPISSVLRGTPITPLVLTAVLLLPAHPFWVNYQNIWVALGDGITAQNAFDSLHRLRLAHVYAVATLLALSVAILYWKALGLL
jgi:DASS family divalent anion:Na+ symporter